MEIITGYDVDTDRTYKLKLTARRLSQFKKPEFPNFFVMLRDFNIRGGSASLRLKARPSDLRNPFANTGYTEVYPNDVNRRIGCTVFGKRTWAKIKRAIAAAK